AILGPTLELGQGGERRLIGEDRAARDALGPHVPGRAGQAALTPELPERSRGLGLQLDESLDGFDRIAEQESGTLKGTEEVPHHREGATFDAREEDGRALRLVDAPLHGGDFEVGVDFLGDLHKLAVTTEVVEALGECTIAHDCARSYVDAVSELQPTLV